MRMLRGRPFAEALRIQHVTRIHGLWVFFPGQSSSPSQSFHQHRHAHTVPTTTRASAPATFRVKTHRLFEEQQSLFLPPISERRNPASWARLIEPYLPIELRKPVVGEVDTTSAYQLSRLSPTPTEVTRIILTARSAGNVSILAYLGLEEGRWEAVLWIARMLVDTSPSPYYDLPDSKPVSNIIWPSTRTLENLTTETFSLDYRRMDELGHRYPLTGYQYPLTGLGVGKKAIRRNMSVNRGKAALGEIWQSLGNLIFAASNNDPEDSRIIMFHVFRIIADLHHKGCVPENVYRFFPNDDPSVLHQPPLLHAVYSKILTALSDAVYQSQIIQNGGQADGLAISSRAPGSLHKSRGLEIGTEVWMEFVLWCCVHGSWLREGASILDMTRRSESNEKPWSLIDWRDAAEPATSDRHPAEFERSISTEVVIALVDGLITSLTRSADQSVGQSIAQAVDTIKILKSILHSNDMGLVSSNWDILVSRFAEIPGFEVESNPRLMEGILELAEVYGQSINASNAPRNHDDLDSLATYVLEPSAASIGLYHRTLHAYVKSRDINGALQLLSRLLLLTDENKSGSLKEFLEELMSHPVLVRRVAQGGEHGLNVKSIFPGVQYPGFHPDIPVNILADLLDLITESGAVEVGRWMVRSSDIDGPLIPETLYGNQSIAPALIRFAATTSDTALLRQLMKTQTTTVSARTLIALCDGRIREGSWQGAADVLRMMLDHSLHIWAAEDVALLLRPLLVKILKDPPARYREADSLPAPLLLQRLMRGDLGQVWGADFSECDAIVGVMTSINPLMARICSGMLMSGRGYSLAMSDVTFDLLLQGVTDALGSSAGWQLLETWCDGSGNDREIALSKTASRENFVHPPSASEAFFGKRSDSKNDASTGSNFAVFTGVMTKRIESIRIIIRQALREYRESVSNSKAGRGVTSTPFEEVIIAADEGAPNTVSERLAKARNQTAQPSPPGHEVLDWLAQVLRIDFNLSHTEIDYELEGYVTAQTLHLPPERHYSAQTLSIYEAFSGWRRQWIRAREERLRRFVNSYDERQIIFEHVPPAERYFLHCLAADFGLMSESFGEEDERAVKMSKTPMFPRLPVRTVEEVVRRP